MSATGSMSRPVLVAALGVLTVFLDSAVNIAFPAISAAFGVPDTSIQWVVLTYVVTFAAALIPAGRLADRVGHARVFQGGLALTGLAHVLCGLAPAWAWLLGARVVQGLGAALVMASAPALVTLSTDASRHGQALGRLGLAASLGMVLGPLAGGPSWDSSAGAWCISAGFRSRRSPSGSAGVFARRRGARAGASRAGAEAIPAGGARHGPPGPRARERGEPPGERGALRRLAPRALLPPRPARLLGGARGPPLHGGAARLGVRSAARRAPGRPGRRRWLAPLALAVASVGTLADGAPRRSRRPGGHRRALGIGGAGYGLFVVANMHYVMRALPRARQGIAGSLVGLMRTAGIVVGATVTTAVYASRLSVHAALGPVPPPPRRSPMPSASRRRSRSWRPS